VETPPGVRAAAGYLAIKNAGSADDRLFAVESDLKVEMHASKVADGVASMKEMADGFAVPAGATVGLGEDSTYAMFMG
jgi:copper(I)-binding protein